ncbi:MAG: arginase [Bacteroidota bacterium]
MPAIKIIKNRSDIGAGTRGSDLGVDAIEVAAINAESTFFKDLPYVDVKTHNETIYDKVKGTFAKRITHVREQCQRVASVTREVLRAQQFPIVLSGDHSSALGTISGIKAQYPDKRLGIIWIDAHADLHSPFTSPSGNVHGMPLAAALDENNLEHQINQVTPYTQGEWERLKNVGIDGPKVLPEHLLFFGVRDTEAPEDYLMERLNIKNYTVHEVRYRGLQRCLAEAKEQLHDCDLLYISFDVDSLDCDLISKGTGTPVSKGFDPHELILLINGLMASGKVACLEICEVNPLLDNKGNKMAETAFKVLEAVVEQLHRSEHIAEIEGVLA